ncbi:MAG TPA: hemerythrin domain-containing protein [Candidatus Limnocylindria bacterium]
MITTPNAEAADAIRAHHAELSDGLRRRVAALDEAVAQRQEHAPAQAEVLAFLDGELLPHAAAEEKALYPAGEVGPTALLVRSMIGEHRNLLAHVDALRAAGEPIAAVGLSNAIRALFESHLVKENDLLIPALAADPQISLAELLGGMHELLGG